MTPPLIRILFLSLLPLALFCPLAQSAPSAEPSWQDLADAQLERLGHRNVIIVADSAYPIQTGDGIRVFTTGTDHLEVVKYMAEAIEMSKAVRPLIALDREFAYVPDKHAAGAAALRKALLALLDGRGPLREELHEQLLAEVNATASEYEVIVFKTTGIIPYSSVFFTLDCGYWSAEAEADLRRTMAK